MAFDPEKYGKFRDGIDEFVESVPGVEGNAHQVIDDVIDPFLDEYDDLLSGSRPPRLYVFGRTGAGKSSLINALANKHIASVGAVEPETVESNLYTVSFPERHSDWEIVDSRGLFESVTPDGDLPADTIEFMKEDIEEYRPDILLHVMTPDQVRAGEDDFKRLNELRAELGDTLPPIVYVLNKVDTHMSAGGDWPPEKNPELSKSIQRNLEFVSDVVSDVIVENDFDVQPFDQENAIEGYQFDSEKFVGVVPVYLKDDPYWNIDTLSWLIGDFLPEDARLQFFQAQERASIMRNIAKDVTKTSASSAATIGAAPTSYADIIPITALQYAQVALIARLSCREQDMKAVTEYISSMGVVSGAAIALREVARGLIQFAPGAGQAISGGVAGAGTYAIGKSAEKYFFDDLVEEPDDYLDEGEMLYAEEESNNN